MSHPLASLVTPLRYACQRDFAALGSVKDLRSLLGQALKAAEKEGYGASVLAPLRAELSSVDHPALPLRRASLSRVVRALALAGVELPDELARLTAGGPAPGAGVPGAGAPQAPRPAAAPGPVPGGGRAPPQPPRAAAPAKAPVPPEAPAASPPARSWRTPALAPTRATVGAVRAAASAGAPAVGEEGAPEGEKAPAAPPRKGKRAKQEPLGLEEGKAGRRKGKRKKAVGQEASRAEAKLLSIAPRHGPLSIPLKNLGGKLAPRLVGALNRKGLQRVGDVLFLLPRCYEDRRRLSTIAELVPGERGITVATVRTAGDSPMMMRGGTPRRGFKAVLADATGSIAVTYFNGGPWLKARFPVGQRLVISGEVRASYSGREMLHPEVESADDLESSKVHFKRVVPIYPGFERGEQRAFRELAHRVAEGQAAAIGEPLPADLRQRLGLLDLAEALRRIHFPREEDDLESLNGHQSAAHQRLAFDELFFLQLGLALKRQGVKVEPGIAFTVSGERLARARGALPFQLTRAQAKVVAEISRDMARPEPMNRLLQGDVGSGKTAVALVSALLALQDGYQVAVMAPTELLAEQHFRTFDTLLAPLGYPVGLVSSSGTAKQKREVRERVARGEVRVAVGTHALLEESVGFDRLGLVVIDEQHRFGVLQRHTLMSKGVRPDVLVMTATPIPRTLAMTLYGDLEVSVIDELPPGRTPITTRVFSDKQRARVYEAVGAELAKGHQAYVVYPLVEESEKLDLEDATRGREKLQQTFPDYRVGLLHGRMRPEEKDAVMGEFRAGRLHLLVATTVVEVGVDVPNASVMVVEAAERFGLSQLHQLRGRVGRGSAQSHCFLVAGGSLTPEGAERLAVMERSSNGFVIAEKDLEIRGPGEFLGTRQSGIPELAVANLVRDVALLEAAQLEARRVVEGDPRLERPEHAPLVQALEERWEGRLALAKVG